LLEYPQGGALSRAVRLLREVFAWQGHTDPKTLHVGYKALTAWRYDSTNMSESPRRRALSHRIAESMYFVTQVIRVNHIMLLSLESIEHKGLGDFPPSTDV